MQTNYPNLSNAPQPALGITMKELNFISDSLNIEDMLSRLCAHSASQMDDAQLSRTLGQIARDRLQHYDRCMMLVKQQTGYLH